MWRDYRASSRQQHRAESQTDLAVLGFVARSKALDICATSPSR